jgi:hypothetical protein
MIPGAPPPGTLHKRPRPSTAFAAVVERARQPTGGWKEGDRCTTPTGRLARVVAVHGASLELRYQQEGNAGRAAERGDTANVTLKAYLCRWLSPREVRSLQQPAYGHRKEGGDDATT